MRIAIYHNLPSGGAKRALYELSRRLVRTCDIDVYTLSCADHEFCDLRPYSKEHIVFPFEPWPLVRRPFGRLNQGIRTLDLFRLGALQRQVASKIDAGGYDVVLVNHCLYERAPSLLRLTRTPTVYYCQEPPRLFYEPQIPRPYLRLSRLQRLGNCLDPLPLLYRTVLSKHDRANVWAASRVLVNSAYSRESLYRAYGISSVVSYLGVDPELFLPLDLPRQGSVLSVGVLDPRKGFDFLLRGLALIDEVRRPPLVLVSNAADSREREYLAALADHLGVSVAFKILISDDDLVRLYNSAALTLYTPVMEPFGFVPLESMACGTPVVGVREGGVRESVVDDVTGILVDRDPAELASAVRELLADGERLDRYGRQGRQHVLKNWTWEASVAQLERHLEDVASVPGRPA